MIQNHKFALPGALMLIVAIILGAFAAHSLKEKLTEEQLVSFETGVRYLFYAGFSCLFFSFSTFYNDKLLKQVYYFIILGAIFFSGSIFLLNIQDLMGIKISKFIWPITPIGGLLLILAWIFYSINLLKNKNK